MCAFTFLLLHSHACYSQIDESLFELSLSELLSLRVTGSTLTEQTINNAPSAVTVFDHAFISTLGVDYLHELLVYVAGFQSQRSADTPNAYGYSARGRRNGNQSKEILLLMDGLVLNDPRTGAANSAVRMFSVRQIERIEIIRGPSSALYGSGAYSGVINIQTRKGVDDWQLQAGSHNRVAGSVNTHVESGAWDLNVFASIYDDKGERYVVDDNFNQDPSVRIPTQDPLKKSSVHLRLDHGDSSFGYFYHNTQADDFYSLETLSNGFSFNESILHSVYAKQNYSLSQGIQSFVSFSFSHVEQFLHTQVTAAGDLAPISNPSSDDPLFLKAYLKSQSLKFNWHNDWYFNEDISFQTGLNWQIDDEVISEAANNFDTGQLTRNESSIDYFGDFTQVTRADHQDLHSSVGIYWQSIYQFNTSNQINAGLRYDRNKIKQSHLSPRVGWVHQISGLHSIKLLYGEAFRAASLNETANPDSPILRGSTSLKHEVIKTLDAICLYQFQHVNLQLGLFFNRYEHPILIEISSDNVRQYANGKAASGQGFEAEINCQLGQFSSLRVTYFEMFDKPDAFFREAKRQASVLFSVHGHSWLGTLGAIYGGEKEMISGTQQLTLNDYVLLSGKVKYQVNSNLNVSMQVKNLLDNNYESAPQGSRLNEGIPNSGIEGHLQMDYSFN